MMLRRSIAGGTLTGSVKPVWPRGRALIDPSIQDLHDYIVNLSFHSGRWPVGDHPLITQLEPGLDRQAAMVSSRARRTSSSHLSTAATPRDGAPCDARRRTRAREDDVRVRVFTGRLPYVRLESEGATCSGRRGAGAANNKVLGVCPPRSRRPGGRRP